MTQQALDSLMTTYEDLPAEEVRKPNIPAHVTTQEALETVQFVRQTPAVAERLALVGVDDAALADVEVAAHANDRAALLAKLAISGVKSEAAIKVVDDAEALRQRILDACRFNLRKDRDAQAKVRRIADGSGTLDLYTDINLCAELLREHPRGFDNDGTFDADAALADCESLAPQLSALLTNPADSLAREAALTLRDRAWTHLDTLLDDLREAGRYALRDHPQHRARFASQHAREANARYLKKKAQG